MADSDTTKAKHIDYVMEQSKKYIRGYIEGQQEALNDLIIFVNQLSRRLDRAKRKN